jgi:hypothetical protein
MYTCPTCGHEGSTRRSFIPLTTLEMRVRRVLWAREPRQSLRRQNPRDPYTLYDIFHLVDGEEVIDIRGLNLEEYALRKNLLQKWESIEFFKKALGEE